MRDPRAALETGSRIMVSANVIFLIYAIAFYVRGFSSNGFEIGVASLNGVTPADLDALNPAIMAYITHLHLAVAGFIASTSLTIMALSYYAVRRGHWWAWLASVIAPIVALAAALPKHYMGEFDYNWVTHLGPVYVGTLIFVIGASMALSGIIRSR